MEAVKVEVVEDSRPNPDGFSPGDLLMELNKRMNRSVSRSALFRWRQKLRFFHPPYYDDHVEALMIYGNLIGLGMKPDAAKDATEEQMELREIYRGKTNHD
jgi:hypothetical protein